MAISESTNIKFATNLPVLPRALGPHEQFNPLGGYMRPWFVTHEMTGAAGGGAVDLVVLTRPDASVDPLFLSVSKVRTSTNDTTAGSQTQFNGQTEGDWQYGKNEVRATILVAELFQPNDLVIPDNPAVFGEITQATTGALFTSFQTNTDTKKYRVQMHGWISDRPFLTPLTLFPG